MKRKQPFGPSRDIYAAVSIRYRGIFEKEKMPIPVIGRKPPTKKGLFPTVTL